MQQGARAHSPGPSTTRGPPTSSRTLRSRQLVGPGARRPARRRSELRPASGSRSVSSTSSPSRSAAAIPAMSETARRRPSGSRAKGWGGIRRAGRRRGPGVDRPFPPSAQRARRPEPVSQAAWRTITRPYWRGAATAPGLTRRSRWRAGDRVGLPMQQRGRYGASLSRTRSMGRW